MPDSTGPLATAPAMYSHRSRCYGLVVHSLGIYDAEDRLVICNSRYHEQLYPGMSEVVRTSKKDKTAERTRRWRANRKGAA